MSKANEMAKRDMRSRVANAPSRRVAQQVPAGWVTKDEFTEGEGAGDSSILDSYKSMQSIPAKLYTDFSGTNLITITINGEEYYLPLRTD